ncbi:putative RNA-directed DNA polymerase [Helianthus debilis subsp. tardiflorus]
MANDKNGGGRNEEDKISPIPGLNNEQFQQFIRFFGNKEQATKEENAPVTNVAGNFNREGKWDIRSRELIGAGECFKGLYKMAMMGTERQAMMASVNTWHKRLGHASNSKLSHVGFIKNASLKSKGVCDSDWLGCPMTRRSRTGYLLLLGGTPISWKSKKQLVVSRSSAEAEYRAMASTVSEVLWLRWLLRELEISCPGPTQLFCDNQAARHIANNPVFHERTKHVEMDCCFVRERVEAKEILPMAINTTDQIADVFTKPLGTQNLQALLGKLGIINLHART